LGGQQYQNQCAVCHGDSGEGSTQLNAPSLVGCSVCNNAASLSKYIAQYMPPVGASAPKACAGECAVNVSRYIQETFNTSSVSCNDATNPSPSTFKRLSRLEYSNSIKDLLQLPQAPNVGAIPNDPSVYNFQTIASVQSVQASHISGYLSIASEQAEALMNAADRRDKVIGCDYTRAGCLDTFIPRFGRLAYRRPLEASEVERLRAFVSGQSNAARDQFVLALQVFFTSPNFIFRVEVGNNAAGLSKLNDYELASRLAFALWGQGPTADLLDKVASGALASVEGLRKVAGEMLKDPRARANMTHFFEQWLATNLINAPVEKPENWYTNIIADMQAETDTLLGDYVWQNKNFLQVLTDNTTYLTPGLADYYGLPRPAASGQAITLPSSSPRANTGILGHAANLFAKSDGDLLAKRGNWLRSTFLCKELHLPNGITDIINGKFAGFTPMEIITERNRDPACERCHAQIDPIGLVFAPFDRSGRFDASVRLADYPIQPGLPDRAGARVSNIQDLVRELAQMPEVGQCLADRLFLYTRNHLPEQGDQCAVNKASGNFRATGNQFTALLLALVEDPSFRNRVAPAPETNEPEPQSNIVNLAQNRPVTTSSAQDGNPGSRLTDNNLNADSRWSAQTYPQQAIIDLGLLRRIVQIEAYPYEDRAYKYTVEISRDGTNFTRLVDRSKNTQTGASLTDLFAPAEARYVRIVVTGATGYTGDWISFREIKVLGAAP
jgi:hypothetical protein